MHYRPIWSNSSPRRALVGQRPPLRRHALGTPLRQRKDRECRVRCAFSRKDTWSGNPEVGDFMALAVTVDNRIGSARPHDGAAQEMAGWHRAAPRPRLLRARRLGDFQSLFEIGIPQRDRVGIETV